VSKHRFKPNRRNQLASFTLSFGRYHGKTLKSIPRSYLRWLVRAEGIPIGDVWAVSQFLGLSSRRPTYDSAASNRCVNDVMETVEQSAEAEQR
jgi:uncharacterized protein (DUF3820 family)